MAKNIIKTMREKMNETVHAPEEYVGIEKMLCQAEEQIRCCGKKQIK